MKATTTATSLRHCKKRRIVEIERSFDAEFRAEHAKREHRDPWEHLLVLKALQSRIDNAKRARGLMPG